VYSKENEREKEKDKKSGAICRGTMNCALLYLLSFGYCGHDASCPYPPLIPDFLHAIRDTRYLIIIS